MTRLVLIRHAPTGWNAERRLQGRSDQPLSDAGRAAARTWALPQETTDWEIVSSPLARARETARILSGKDPAIDDRLIELSFGTWEGQRLSELRTALGEEMRLNEAKGLDFLPPGGESPRKVAERVRPFLAERALRGTPCVGVAHKAVIRAVYALASGWDMTIDPPVKLRDACCHMFEADKRGRVTVARLNIPLTRADRVA